MEGENLKRKHFLHPGALSPLIHLNAPTPLPQLGFFSAAPGTILGAAPEAARAR